MHWPVVVAGSDRDVSGRRHSLDGVQQLGHLAPAALHEWYARAAVFVQPSLYEPFGLAPLEAARAGAALVLADIPSLREVWGDTALYVAPRDSSGLAAAVNTLAEQPAFLAERSAAARRRASTLTARAMALHYLESYRELMTPASRRDGRSTRDPATAAATPAPYRTVPAQEAAT
jgi:glycogen synthase